MQGLCWRSPAGGALRTKKDRVQMAVAGVARVTGLFHRNQK
jgi:hypothetical protein